jgi:hypothetical protein
MNSVAPVLNAPAMAHSSNPAIGSPETELLCLCARMTLDPSAAARITALVRHDLDWNFVIVTAHRHRVLPLVYRTLGRIVPDDVPAHAMQRLQSAFHLNATRNLFLTAELLRLIDLLSAADIPCIPYKGPAMASLLYGDVSLRQFTDLDIIVPVEVVARAIALLMSLDYRPTEAMSRARVRACTRTHKDITLVRGDGRINLEVHWGITTDKDPIRIRPKLLWKNPGACSIAGRSVRTLRPEELLLILCIHGAKHLWERLGWLCDVAEIVRSHKPLEWNRVLDTAKVVGAERILYLGLALASELLGADPPAKVLQALRADSVVRPLAEQVKGWLSSEPAAALDLGERERYFMRLRERPTDRCRVALKQAK